MTPLDDADLIAGFEACTVPNESFHHADHVRVAWLYLGRSSWLAAADTFTTNLRRFAAAHGKPERYHATITCAYLLLIHDRIVTRGRGGTWSEFAGANPDLLTWQPSILTRYYSQELLASELARGTFLWPDRLVDVPRFSCGVGAPTAR
jgi:hypothetical protein